MVSILQDHAKNENIMKILFKLNIILLEILLSALQNLNKINYTLTSLIIKPLDGLTKVSNIYKANWRP